MALAAETAPALAQAIVPTNLQALEQKMAQIHFNTSRVSVRFVLGELGSPAGEAELGSGVNECKGLIISSVGVERLSPAASMSIGELNGTSKSEERTIGNTIYTYTPSAARYDGGRPWVRSTQKPAGGSVLGPTHSGSASDGASGQFAKLIEEVNAASSIQEVGPLTVDEQQITEFTASLSLAQLLSPQQLAAFTKASSTLNDLPSPTDSPKQPAGAKKRKAEEATKKLGEAPVELELFIASSGMPVRSTVVIGKRSAGIGIEKDILAVEVPVVVHAPPASETIGQARLRKLEKQQFKKELQSIKKKLRSHKLVRLPRATPSPSMAQCPPEGNEGSGGIIGPKGAEPSKSSLAR